MAFLPETGDSIEIYPKYADKRISINTAVQTLDYVTSTTYGRGLDPKKDLDLPSWLESARICDTQSDVTIKFNSDVTSVAVGDVYKYPSSGNIKWQGKVKSKSGQYVTFTEVIGKLTNKWKTWKSYSVNDLVYAETTMYTVTNAGIFGTLQLLIDNSTTGTANITKVSGSGSSSLQMNSSAGNPIRALRNGKEISGYSLYDSDGIDYWRLSGWDEYSQRYVTKYQTNLVIDTSAPLFDNTNALLEHFNGIMRYTAGKYYLSVDKEEDAIPDGDIRNITPDDIVGRIQLSDEGVRNSYNSLTAAFPDPANKFEARNISFFNSDFLKIDKNIPKKGNLSLPGITNYYNTRLVADAFLVRSRYGLTVNCTLRHHGILLLAGTVIELTYKRYKWNNKPFRIKNISYQPNGLVDIVAEEYDDSFYAISRIERATSSGATAKTRRLVSVGPPSALNTSNDTNTEFFNVIRLDWQNNPEAINNASRVVTEIYGSRARELDIRVVAIDGQSILTTAEPFHYLVPGMPITVSDTYLNELYENVTYYVLETKANNNTLADNEFTLSGTMTPLIPSNLPASRMDLTPALDLELDIRTAQLLGSVNVPGNSFVDTIPNEGGLTRVDKYYWIRHKVTEI